jgi:hypothetical protein
MIKQLSAVIVLVALCAAPALAVTMTFNVPVRINHFASTDPKWNKGHVFCTVFDIPYPGGGLPAPLPPVGYNGIAPGPNAKIVGFGAVEFPMPADGTLVRTFQVVAKFDPGVSLSVARSWQCILMFNNEIWPNWAPWPRDPSAKFVPLVGGNILNTRMLLTQPVQPVVPH